MLAPQVLRHPQHDYDAQAPVMSQKLQVPTVDYIVHTD